MKRVPIPESIVWEVTPRCNLSCRHCYNVWTAPGQSRPAELDLSTARIVLANIASAAPSLKSLTLSGGEPLLRSDITSLVVAAAQAFPRADISLATNGQMLTAQIAKELKRSGVKTLQLTLLAADPTAHDSLAGSDGAFVSVLAAIAAAKEAGLLVAAFFVATRLNIAAFPGVAKLALAIGADTVVFNRFQPGGRALAYWKDLTPSAQELTSAYLQVAELRACADISFGTIIPPCETPVLTRAKGEVVACPIGTKYAYPAVDPAGNLRPCNHSPVVAGSLLDTAFRDLLDRPCMAQAPPPSECSDCDWLRRCRGGCPAARSLAGERIYARRQ